MPVCSAWNSSGISKKERCIFRRQLDRNGEQIGTYQFCVDQSLGLSKSQPYVAPIYSCKFEYQTCRRSAVGSILSLLRHAMHSGQHHGMPTGTFEMIIKIYSFVKFKYYSKYLKNHRLNILSINKSKRLKLSSI